MRVLNSTVALAAIGLFSLGAHPPAKRSVAPSSAQRAMLDKIPASTLREMTDPTKSIGFPGLAWPVPVVTVAFHGGDPQLYALIEATAKEWTAHGGRLTLSFRRPGGDWRTWRETDTTPAADIRIGFFRDEERDGYWSAVGTLARRVSASRPTMNFGDLGTTLSSYYGGANATQWVGSYSHGTILHEFGHALGLNHEHFHPQCQADLKMPQIVAYLMGSPNGWSREQAMFNMDGKTYFDIMKAHTGSLPVSMSSNIDRASVMLYSFQNRYYKKGVASPCRPSSASGYASSLSNEDRRYYLANYPNSS